MNWIKENKFLTGFFAVMLAGLGALGYLLFAAMGGADEAATRYNGLASELGRLQNLPLSPNQKNLDALVAQKKDAVEVIAAFQTSLAAKSFPLVPMTPEEFQDKLKATKTAVLERASQGGTHLPDKFFLGADTYETRPPTPEAAGPLGRELKAIEWVLNQLFDNHVAELKPMKRDPLPEESGKKGDKKGKALVSTHSFELSMVCRPPAFAAVLNAITGPKAPQYYIPRIVRIKSQNDKGPPRVVNVPPPAPAPAPSTNPPAPGTPPSPPPPPASNGPSQYIVGDEQLEVTMVIDIVDFAEPAAAAPSK